MINDIQTLTLLLVLLSLVVSVLTAIYAKQSPQKIDSDLASRLDEIQQRREYMDKLERGYERAARYQQDAINTLADVLKSVAPRTAIKADDALLRLLEDIKAPGVPKSDSPQDVQAIDRAAIEAAKSKVSPL